jgi:DNA-directed RNA polymerase subunit E'
LIEIFKLVTLEDLVRIPPDRFGSPLEETVKEILRRGYDFKGRIEGGYEGKLDKDLGMILLILDIKDIKEGSLIPGDGGAYHHVTFEVMTYKPDLHEVIDAEVVEIVEFGAFIRFGPLDGLIHVSQVTDDYIVYDEKRGALLGKESGRALQAGDKVRARIVAISLNPERSKESKINLTMRQPGLGKFEWLEEDKKKGKGKKKKAAPKKEAKK